MANEQETIVDIIADKRRVAEHIRNNLSTVPVRQWDQQAEIRSLEDEADRLEAALKRELSKICPKTGGDFGQLGDVAKLREALKGFDAALDIYPLEIIATHTADMLASRVTEAKENKKEAAK